MEDEVFGLEFGNEALYGEDKGAFFKVVGNLCLKYFGAEDTSRSLIDNIERVGMNGSYVRLSRVVVRNLGCIVGSIIELDYFEPSETSQFGINMDEPDIESDEIQDIASFVGRHMHMTFDTSDGSFHRSEALSKLIIDEFGDYELDDIELFESVDEIEEEEKDDELTSILSDEAGTPTIDDHFILNTVALLLDAR